MGQQQGVRERADPAGNGSEGRGDVAGRGEIHVAHEPTIDDIDADVDDDGAELEHRTGHEARMARRDHDDVGTPHVVGETAGPTASIKPMRFMMRAEL